MFRPRVLFLDLLVDREFRKLCHHLSYGVRHRDASVFRRVRSGPSVLVEPGHLRSGYVERLSVGSTHEIDKCLDVRGE